MSSWKKFSNYQTFFIFGFLQFKDLNTEKHRIFQIINQGIFSVRFSNFGVLRCCISFI